MSPVGRYSFTGDALVFPATISDDASKTYLTWSEGSEIPAVFAVNQDGDDMLVNGHMRGGVYVLDEVHSRLRLRLGRAEALAKRLEEGDQ